MCAGCIKEDKATEELLGEEGWMHGGDTGALDAEGYLRMTAARWISSSCWGRNMAPQGVETYLCSHPSSPKRWSSVKRGSSCPTDHFGPESLGAGRRNTASSSSRGPRQRSRPVRREFSKPSTTRAIDGRTPRVIRKFRIVAHDLTVAEGGLWTTLKVRCN